VQPHRDGVCAFSFATKTVSPRGMSLSKTSVMPGMWRTRPSATSKVCVGLELGRTELHCKPSWPLKKDVSNYQHVASGPCVPPNRTSKDWQTMRVFRQNSLPSFHGVPLLATQRKMLDKVIVLFVLRELKFAIVFRCAISKFRNTSRVWRAVTSAIVKAE
jgi:hypothetical protein